MLQGWVKYPSTGSSGGTGPAPEPPLAASVSSSRRCGDGSKPAWGGGRAFGQDGSWKRGTRQTPSDGNPSRALCRQGVGPGFS